MELRICSNLWFRKTLKSNQEDVFSTSYVKYSQLFITHSNEGKPQGSHMLSLKFQNIILLWTVCWPCLFICPHIILAVSHKWQPGLHSAAPYDLRAVSTPSQPHHISPLSPQQNTEWTCNKYALNSLTVTRWCWNFLLNLCIYISI